MKINFHLLILGILVVLPFFSFAQALITVEQKTVSMSQGEQPAYIVNVPEADFDQVTKDWEKIIRQNTKSKVEESGQELVIMGTQIPEIHHNPINIFSTLFQADSSIIIVAVYEIDSTFFSFSEENKNLHSEKTNNHITHFMRNFAVEQYKEFVEEEFETEDKKLIDLSKELEDLAKKHQSFLEEIEENQQDIKNAEDVISSSEKDNERKLEEINIKKESMASVSDDPIQFDAAKDQLKDLEKEKRNIENILEKEKKNIVKYNSSIEEYNRKIEANLEQQEMVKASIEEQKIVVSNVNLKLKGIK
ncbi:MAG: hypothetical protein R2764_16120 [Bacteroidales bacterium]